MLQPNRFVKSSSFQEARKNILNLYRECMREAPNIIASYELGWTPVQLRNRIREEFDKYADETDPNIMDQLCLFGTMELEETRLIWKQKNHIISWILNPQDSYIVHSRENDIEVPVPKFLGEIIARENQAKFLKKQ
jgi:hypothetical protein